MSTKPRPPASPMRPLPALRSCGGAGGRVGAGCAQVEVAQGAQPYCGNCWPPSHAQHHSSRANCTPGRPALQLGRHPWRRLPPPPPPPVAAVAAAAAAAPIGLQLSWLQWRLAARAAAGSCAPAAGRPPPGRGGGRAAPPCPSGSTPSRLLAADGGPGLGVGSASAAGGASGELCADG